MSRRRHVVAFANGPEDRVAAMCADLRRVLPNFEHHLVREESWLELIERFPPWSVAHTAALLGEGSDAGMRLRALAIAPTRMLAYDPQGERFHLHPKQWLASILFCCGMPVDKIHWRPWRDDSVHYPELREYEGKAVLDGRPTIAVLSPYLPWPLSHGGAVRIYSLLRESADSANIHLCCFLEEGEDGNPGPLLDFCSRVSLVRKPKSTRWRWASQWPPEVHEFRTPAMERLWASLDVQLRQVEFTQLASYPGDILVEHDITMDLAEQEYRREATTEKWWNWKRWCIFEKQALQRYRAIAVMSEKDRIQVRHPRIAVLPNGVDLERFQPREEEEKGLLFFLGSFRHYPNALAYRFLAEEFWPRLGGDAKLLVVAGPQAETFYPFGKIPQGEGIRLLGFVSDVESLYARAQIVLIPTPVSAGTNIKALEAMACGKAILSTPSGVNGLGLTHGENVWIAEGAEGFVEATRKLLGDAELRQKLGRNARRKAEAEFGWQAIARQQEKLWQTLLR